MKLIVQQFLHYVDLSLLSNDNLFGEGTQLEVRTSGKDIVSHSDRAFMVGDHAAEPTHQIQFHELPRSA